MSPPYIQAFLRTLLSVEKASTSPRAAVTVQLVAGVFDGEFVVIRKLFPAVDLPQREDNDVLLSFHVDDPRVTVWLTRVVDKTCRVAVHGSIHYVEVVDAKHVAADTLERAAGDRNRFISKCHSSARRISLSLLIRFNDIPYCCNSPPAYQSRLHE